MENHREHRRATSSLDKAREDPGALYDADYYDNGCAVETHEPYGRSDHWLTFFGRVAKKINRRFAPRTAVDVGCAFGLLVEALNDLGVETWGFDVSPYAVSQARNDMKERIKVHSILEPIPLQDGRKYDLALCIEVLEHLPPEQADRAITNLCAAANRIIFSSSPDDFEEPTHFNVLPTEKWIEKFASHGFRPGKKGAEFIAPHALVLENSDAPRLPFFSWLR